MNKLKLSHRLQTIVNIVPVCDLVADIGCDHGKVLAKLFLENKVKRAIASDISAPSVEKAKQLLTELGYIDQVSIVVGDGMQNVCQDKIDVAIVAGMGGREILQIMENCQSSVETWVLQPMSDVAYVREYLIKNGYKIAQDQFFYDKGKYYTLLKVETGKQKLNQLQIKYGVDYKKDCLLKEYLGKEMEKVSQYLEQATSQKQSKELSKKYKELKKVIRSIHE